MTKYVVMCERDGDQPPIFLIDDDRATGQALRVESNNVAVKRSARSHRGGAINTHGRCGGRCGRNLDLSDATVADLLDRINIAALATMPVATYEPVDDPAVIEAWRVERHGEVLAELSGSGPAPARSSDTPMTAESEIRYVIPFGVLCQRVSELSKDR